MKDGRGGPVLAWLSHYFCPSSATPVLTAPLLPPKKTSVTSQVFRAPMSPLAATSRLLKITVRFGHLVVAWPRHRKRKATAARVVCGRGKPSTGERKSWKGESAAPQTSKGGRQRTAAASSSNKQQQQQLGLKTGSVSTPHPAPLLPAAHVPAVSRRRYLVVLWGRSAIHVA